MKRGKNRTAPRQKQPGSRKKLTALVSKLKLLVYAGVPVILLAGLLYFVVHTVPGLFRIRSVELSGNEHLTDEELRQIGGLQGNESMLTLSSRKVFEKLKESPWIQAAAVRKEYPSKLLIRIRETEPFALLDMKGKMFIVDEGGRMLEELRDSTVPFLPVVLGDPYAEKEAFREAMNLVRAIRGMGLLHKNERIEIIAHKINEISVNLDGMLVKVGAGDHEEKLARLMETGEEIRKRDIPVGYVDLRFSRKVVVKPVNEVIR